MDIGDKRRNRIYRIFAAVMAGIFLAMACFPAYVYAADIKVLSTVVYDGSIYVYIRGVDKVESDSVVQIGNVACTSEQVAVAPLSDLSPTMRTIVLIDNSKSIPNNNHEDIQNILHGIVSASKENEQIKIGTFSDKVIYLCDYTNDKAALDSVIDGINYNDQDAYLSDVLYDVISELKTEDTYTYTRILIFSDGADNKSIGYTNDEVRDYIGQNGYPIYTVGFPAKNNSSELEMMFSFSRSAKSEYFFLDGSVSDEDITSALLQDQCGICIKINPQESLKDGGNKSILLKLSTAEGMVELTTSATMPFGTDAEQGETQENEYEYETEKTNSEEILPTLKVIEESDEEEIEPSRQNLMLPILLGITFVLILILIVGLVLVKKKKLQNKDKVESEIPDSGAMGKSDVPPIDVTIWDNPNEDDDAKELWNTAHSYLIVRDADNPKVMFKVPINDVVHIGRAVTSDIVLDDPKVSREHCEIILRGTLLYLKDCNSKNKTYYENVVVYGETPVVNGGKIKIGSHSYYVELVKETVGERN